MLKIFNDLAPFFWDNYRQVGVREYARLLGISPPTASTLLESLHKEGLLHKQKERQLLLYSASRSGLFRHLSQAYFALQLKELIQHCEKTLVNPTIVLFGSFSKAEVTAQSDIDIAIFTPTAHVPTFPKISGREVHVFVFHKRSSIKSKELADNITSGTLLTGNWYGY